MIKITISNDTYDNDIRKLVKAFYRDEDVVIYKSENEVSNTLKRKLVYDKINKHISFFFVNNQILMKIYNENDILLHELSCDCNINEKHDVNLAVYNLMCRYTKKTLPWGLMTGVHPAKPVLKMLEQGVSENDMINSFNTIYKCDKLKQELIFDIAKREYGILKSIDYKNTYSLYVGIPFCPTTCVYCSFTSFSLEKFSTYVDDYLKALIREIEEASKLITKKKLVTVYVGGGTPTSLTASQLDVLLEKIKLEFDFTNVMEFTVEAGRPDSITKEKLQVMKKHGVSRISINPQTMRQKTLDIVGRRHTALDIKNVYEMARKLGHDNINMDLIMGLPGEDVLDATYTLEEICKLAPENVTVHTLAMKRAAFLNTNKDKYQNMLDASVSEMVDKAYEMLTGKGYVPYYLYRQKNMSDNLENTGYAKEGKECIYNILIMEEVHTILALGAGAVSKFVHYGEEEKIDRVDNVKNLIDYISRVDEMIKKKRDYLKSNGKEFCHEII